MEGVLLILAPELELDVGVTDAVLVTLDDGDPLLSRLLKADAVLTSFVTLACTVNTVALIIPGDKEADQLENSC